MVRRVDLENWGIFLTAVSIVVNVVLSGTIIWLTVRNHRHTTSLAEEQLELARDEAASVPNVEFQDAYLEHIRNQPDLHEEVRESFEGLKRHQREQQEESRRREAHENSGSPIPYISPLWSHFNPLYSPHEGPFPGHCLCIKIGNSGGTAARHVTGWVTLDGGVLEPVDRFLESDVEILEQRDSAVKLKMSVPTEEGTLLVAGEAEHTFRIPVVLQRREDTSLPWELSNSQEEPKKGTFHLSISALEL